MGDAGIIFGADGLELVVNDTQKKAGDLFVHFGKVTKGHVAPGHAVELRVDVERRDRLRANHSATHLLHQALRRVLGGHVTQKGSLVAPDRLRFDFSHPKPMTSEEIAAVEAEEAFSTELCGGTHVRRTGDIGFFKITGEAALAAGVRRIEALTGAAAVDHVEREETLLQKTAAALKVSPAELPARVASLMEERRKLERDLSELRKRLAAGGGGAAAGDGAKEIGGVKFAARRLDGVPARELKAMADALKKQVGSGVVAIAAEAEGKASLVVGVTPDLTDRLNAVEFVRVGAEKLGGKGGGGRPDMAQAGGPDASALQAALDAIEAALAARA